MITISFLTLCACFPVGIMYIVIAGINIIKDDELQHDEILKNLKVNH